MGLSKNNSDFNSSSKGAEDTTWKHVSLEQIIMTQKDEPKQKECIYEVKSEKKNVKNKV